MNTFNPKKRNTLNFEDFLKNNTKVVKGDDHKLVDKAYSGDKEGDKGIDTLAENAEPEVVSEDSNNSKSPADIIDQWVEKYLNANHLEKGKRQYEHEAGTSIETVLNRAGYEIVKKK